MRIFVPVISLHQPTAFGDTGAILGCRRAVLPVVGQVTKTPRERAKRHLEGPERKLEAPWPAPHVWRREPLRRGGWQHSSSARRCWSSHPLSPVPEPRAFPNEVDADSSKKMRQIQKPREPRDCNAIGKHSGPPHGPAPGPLLAWRGHWPPSPSRPGRSCAKTSARGV